MATNKDGIYTISGLPLGTYVVRPTLRGTSFGPAFKAVRLSTADIAAASVSFEMHGADRIAPGVQVHEPLAGRFIAGALRDIVVAGSAQDNRGGVGLVQVSVAVGRFDKDSDAAPSTFLNWNNAASAPTFIGYRALSNEKLAEGTATWRLKEVTAQVLLSQLSVGSYGVRASALDAAGSIGFSSWKRFSVSAGATTPIVTTPIVTTPGAFSRPSPIVLSTSVARSSMSSIALFFSGALNADAATDAACYRVRINDVPVEIERVAYSAAAATVTVGLVEGALRSGDRIVVQWHGLQDMAGRDISGQTSAIIAR